MHGWAAGIALLLVALAAIVPIRLGITAWEAPRPTEWTRTERPAHASFLPLGATQDTHPNFSLACMSRVIDCADSWDRHASKSFADNLGTIRWKAGNLCGFRTMSLDDPTVRELLNNNLLMLHGDSTLREVGKILMGFARIRGFLVKRTANMTFRNALFFVEPPLPMAESAATLKGGAALQARRLSFRFDHYPELLLEPLTDVPSLIMHRNGSISLSYTTTADAFGAHTTVYPYFFTVKGSGASYRVAVLSIGVHLAEKRFNEHKEDPDAARRGIAQELSPLMQYIIRTLGSRADVNPSTSADGKVLLGTPTADFVLVVEQTLECRAMQASKISSFAKMGAHCDALRKYVASFNAELRLAVRNHHPEKSLPALPAHLAHRVVFLSPLECAGYEASLHHTSKPMCTKDGMHFRTRFIRHRADAILNLLLSAAACRLT